MKTTLTTSQAAHLLMQDEYAKWSYNAAFALIEHLEEYEQGCGIELEFDAAAIRCDWREYESVIYAADDFGWEGSEHAIGDALEFLQDKTQVITFAGGVIVQTTNPKHHE